MEDSEEVAKAPRGSSDCTLSSPVAEFGVLSRNAAELIEKLLLDIKSGWSGITGSLVPIVADETGVQDPLSAQNEHLQEIVKECTPGNVLLNSGEINAGLNPASLYVGVDQLASLLASVLNKCDTPNQKELKSEVAQAITSINEFCRTTHLSVEVADHISTLPEVLDTFYAFSAELFFSMCTEAGVDDILLFTLPALLSLLFLWTAWSPKVRICLLERNFLFYHVLQLGCLASSGVEHTMVTQQLSMYSIAILTNCAKESCFQAYYNHIDWVMLLTPWLNSSEESLMMQAKLFCAHLAPFLSTEDLPLLALKLNCMHSLLRSLGAAASSEIPMVTAFGMKFSRAEFLENLQRLIANPSNYDVVSQFEILPTLVTLFIGGDSTEKVAVCGLFWSLLSSQQFRQSVEDSDMPLVELFSVECDDDSSIELKLLCELVVSDLMENFDGVKHSSSLKLLLSQNVTRWVDVGSQLGFSEYDAATFREASAEINKRVLFLLWLKTVQNLSMQGNGQPLNEKSSSLQFLHIFLESGPSANATAAQCHMFTPSASTIFENMIRKSLALISKLPTAFRSDKDCPLSMKLHQQLSEVAQTLKEAATLLQCTCPDISKVLIRTTQLPGLVKTLYQLSSKLVEEIFCDEALAYSYLQLLSLLRWCVHVSQEFRQKVLGNGLLYEHCRQLTLLGSVQSTEFVKNLMLENLRAIYYCSHEANITIFCGNFDWMSLLSCGINSPFMEIQLNTVVLGANLSLGLPDQVCELCELKTNILDLFLELLEASSKRRDQAIWKFGCRFSLSQLLSDLHSLAISSSKNKIMIAKCENIPMLIVHSLSRRENNSVEAACKLLWSLLDAPFSVSTISTSNTLLMRKLEVLTMSDKSEIQLLSKCVLSALVGIETMDIEHKQLYTKGCYLYCNFKECAQLCKDIEADVPNTVLATEMRILRAKALFQIYKAEQMKIYNSPLSIKASYIRQSSCYSKAREVISFLGDALDRGLLDEEGSRMLDTAMMDVAHKANQLNLCNRCFLCREKLQTRKEKFTTLADYPTQDDSVKHNSSLRQREEVQKMPTTKAAAVEEDLASDSHYSKDTSGEVKGKKGKIKLIHSHLFPKAILDRFAINTTAPKGLRVFQEGAGRLKGPREMNRYMLCADCETLLSSNGETQFVPGFFDKLYNPENTTSEQEVKIKYGDWLYKFCIGMLFRNLQWNTGTLVNENEVHKLLVSCRHCLLSLKHHSSLEDVPNKPEVFLLVNPLAAEGPDLQSGLMNRTLSASLVSAVGTCRLDDAEYSVSDEVHAFFFIVHIACINILFRFSLSEEVHISEEFRIKSDTNIHTFCVPRAKERKKLLPPGVWNFFQICAKVSEEVAYAGQHQPNPTLGDESLTSLPHCQAFGIVGGQLEERDVRKKGLVPSPNADEPKQINLLPPPFQIRSFQMPASVMLPIEHSILLHQTFVRDSVQNGFTYFVAVGMDEKFSVDRPYVIWHGFQPGLQLTDGFFISKTNFTVEEFISQRIALKPPGFLSEQCEDMPNTMQIILKTKGFFTLDSLLWRKKVSQKLQLADIKCSSHLNCWYCQQLCNTCLKPAVFGPITITLEDQQLRFCSDECKSMCPGNSTDKSLHVYTQDFPIPEKHMPKCGPVSGSHKKVLHVFSKRTIDNTPCQEEIALCLGDGSDGYLLNKPYAVYYTRTIFWQLAVEFFVSEDMSPSEPLPFAIHNVKTKEMILQLKAAGIIQLHLKTALQAVLKGNRDLPPEIVNLAVPLVPKTDI